MRGEILSIETANKLARIDLALKYINDVLKEAYTTYNLSGETVAFLTNIESMLMDSKTPREKQIEAHRRTKKIN